MARPDVSIRLSLFGISAEIRDVLSYFGASSKAAGPFVIVERQTGLALSTGEEVQNGWQPWLGSLNGGHGQRWTFERTSHKGEILIRSALNGLALDSTWKHEDHAPLLLWEPHAKAHQRWKLTRTPDSVAWLIASAKDERVIDIGRPEDRQPDHHPWMWSRHGAWWQQFLIMPIG